MTRDRVGARAERSATARACVVDLYDAEATPVADETDDLEPPSEPRSWTARVRLVTGDGPPLPVVGG